MNEPRCASCGRILTGAVALVEHRGGALCAYCMDDETFALIDQAFERNPWAYRCQGDCGRLVLDLRNRGQSFLACSERCRRRVFDDYRRMERRAKLPALPPIHCADCGADLHVTRSDMRFCSTRCRVRAHRKRKRKAGGDGKPQV
jgi:hypothetical protein